MEEKQKRLSFTLRVLHNKTRAIIARSGPKSDIHPQSQLQGGILGYIYNHREEPVYQRDIEKEFRISRATATNTLQVMEKNGLVVRKSQDRDGRLKRITMTEEAAENHAVVEEHMRMMEERMLQGLSGEEAAELNRMLAVVLSNLENLETELGVAPEEPEKERSENKQAEGR